MFSPAANRTPETAERKKGETGKRSRRLKVQSGKETKRKETVDVVRIYKHTES